jgi:hypothetical protein
MPRFNFFWQASKQEAIWRKNKELKKFAKNLNIEKKNLNT